MAAFSSLCSVENKHFQDRSNENYYIHLQEMSKIQIKWIRLNQTAYDLIKLLDFRLELCDANKKTLSSYFCPHLK